MSHPPSDPRRPEGEMPPVGVFSGDRLLLHAIGTVGLLITLAMTLAWLLLP